MERGPDSRVRDQPPTAADREVAEGTNTSAHSPSTNCLPVPHLDPIHPETGKPRGERAIHPIIVVCAGQSDSGRGRGRLPAQILVGG